MKSLIEQREEHYEKHIGPIQSEVYHSTDVKPVHIDLYTIPPSENRAYYTLLTGGMSDKTQTIPAKYEQLSNRTEIITYAKESKGWMYNVLKGLAEMPWDHDTFIHWYHSIPNGKPMTAEPSLLTAFFLVPPYFEEDSFNPMFIDSEPVDFLFMVPITDKELAYKRENGSEALLKIFDDIDFDYIIDEKRASFV